MKRKDVAGVLLGNFDILPTAAVTRNDGVGSAFLKAVVSFCSQNIHPPKLVKFPKPSRIAKDYIFLPNI